MKMFLSHPPVHVTIVRGPQHVLRTPEAGLATKYRGHTVVGIMEAPDLRALQTDTEAMDVLGRLEGLEKGDVAAVAQWASGFYDLQGVPVAGPNVMRTAAAESGFTGEELYSLSRPAFLLVAKEPMYVPEGRTVRLSVEALTAIGDPVEGAHLGNHEQRTRMPRGLLTGAARLPLTRRDDDEAEEAGARAYSRVVVELQEQGLPLPQQPLAAIYDALPTEYADGRVPALLPAERVTPPARGGRAR